MRLCAITLPFLTVLTPLASAFKFPLTRRDTSYPVSASRITNDVPYNFTHATNQDYTITITVNGVPYQAVLDTGSSDTWIDVGIAGVTPPALVYTGTNSSTTYVDGTVSEGPLVLANVTFGPYTVYSQAIMVASGVFPTNPALFDGLIGLSTRYPSSIYGLLENTSYVANAQPLLVNAFESIPELPNYFTFLVARADIGFNFGGVFTISEVVEELEGITSGPKYETIDVLDWSTSMRGVYANGQFLDGHSIVVSHIPQLAAQVPDGYTIATIDSGTSFMRGPKYYVDAIYENVPGAVVTQNGVDGGYGYQVPCDTKLNITFAFGNETYPMHPLDAIFVNVTEDGIPQCFGSIGAQNESQPLTEDWLLGDSFMHNVYTLFDYGNETNPTDGKRYMQFLSLTDSAEAWAEFDALQEQRLNQYKAYYTATHGAPKPTATHLAYTGTTPTIAVTAVDNAKETTFTHPPFASIAAVVSALNPSQNFTTTTQLASPTDTSQPQQLAAGDLAEDSDSASDAKSTSTSTLERNSYIIMGMLAGAIALLIALVVVVLRSQRAKNGYRPVLLDSGAYNSKARTSYGDGGY